ncbi:SWIM zinc finger family protein [Halomicroarcula sp. GCM10025709]|uniref:SWIM zinc finger family protein n=1 Tax=Haloarcula TaxID=2237 RepID=UPI0024C30E40|nr:SWIM zinc finger family protein [Halomicroarcula sp. YJ-61-S]
MSKRNLPQAAEPTHPLSRLAFTKRVAKRAQYEAFEFTIVPEGVRVRNGSHANPEEHEYLVRVAGGIPATCTCPADARFDGACKHRVAVVIRAPILDAANRQVVADGGVETSAGRANHQQGESVDEDDGCETCLEEFPCWECVRTGVRALPE